MLCSREKGQTMTEYVTVLTVITLAIVLGYALLAAGVEGTLRGVTALL